ncbi:MAG: very short patch repair endonuclease [Lachnospiraceae bacterium]|nr:very short patch repair endonuclease [Lachnospiraceae bacterium]
MDIMTEEQRHRTMQNVHSKDTSIEVKLRKALWHKGYRYQKNYRKLPGSPDIVLTKYHIVVFCDGEFFHGKNWEVLKPRIARGHNGEYWVQKIERNIDRDKENDQALLARGWTVIRFWGKDILKDTDTCIQVIEDAILDNKVSSLSATDSEE